MATPFHEVTKGWPAERKAEVKARAAELIAEEATLRDLRKTAALTQERMADLLGIAQENVSRLEQRNDMLLSTLSSYVAAVGGDLHLVVQFPDRPSVRLANLGDAFQHVGQPPDRNRLKKKPVYPGDVPAEAAAQPDVQE